MRLNLGLVSGLAVGYVLGTKAGRERYEQILETARKLGGSEPAQQVKAEARNVAEKASTVIEEKASEGVAKVSDIVNRRRDDGTDFDTTTAAPTDPTPLPPS
ncbi:MAG: YtxH domain-containing protein [Euzebyales bacterium]|nr:YtxH domain-containing protein [Euzebyales bacterium]